jgi:pimeloyl-ACP methyl ester carboxylesterase
LIALPSGGASKGLVVFNHGTLADRRASPSRFTGRADSSETELAILAFASGGYAVAIPDYLGLGDHQAAHPYPLGAVNSRSAVDIIAPARTLAARQKNTIGAQLFVSGYSEGGAVGMWTVRDLERKASADTNVTAAALASGPYDISGVTRNSLIASTDNQTTFVTRLYLIAYLVNYFHRSRGIKLTDYFKPAMALTVSQAFKGSRSDENIIKRLALTAVLMRSKNSINNVITTRFKRAMETLDTSDPVIRELRKQDVYDWSPQTKMLLINLKKDNVVDAANTDTAIAAMRRRGVGASSLRQYIIRDESLNHLTAIVPALAQARRFFDGGFSNIGDAP